jgi:ammonia channel protein AmtB
MPDASYVDGRGALIIGVCAGIIPWLSANKLQTSALMNKVDDTLSDFSTHGVAGFMGGLLTGVLANPVSTSAPTRTRLASTRRAGTMAIYFLRSAVVELRRARRGMVRHPRNAS